MRTTHSYRSYRRRSDRHLPLVKPTYAYVETVGPFEEIIIFIHSSSRIMSTSPPTPPQVTPLSLFVLLPASAHSNQPAAVSNARPSPLVSRQSGSRIPSLRSLGIDPSTTLEDTPEIDKVVNAGRRLSLAPGMGAGTHSRGVSPRASGFSPASVPEEPSEDSGSAPPASKAPAFGSKPAFGSGSPTAGRGRRRPQTSNAAQLLPNQGLGIGPRGSMAGTSRAGLIGGGMMGKTRPGWEGDEVVGMLRGSGLEGEFRDLIVSHTITTIISPV